MPSPSWPGGPDVLAPITLALVNNMPDAALRATERQYRDLLSAASARAGSRPVRLRLYSLPSIPRGEAGRSYAALSYEDIGQLWDSAFDGLIVTGSEPRASVLENEPYWPELAQLADWAEERAVPAVWSCLAAQAAVLRFDGIVRRPFGWKLSGVFPSNKAADHPLTAGLPPRWRVPQTRYNDLPEQALASHGYRVISRLPDAGADIFIREGQAPSMFLQGHPEYHPAALLLEYRRDVGRYLAGEQDTYPDPLRGYFDERTAVALEALRLEALLTRNPALIERLPDALAGWTPPHDWHEPAIQLYANWLLCLQGRQRGTASAPAAASRQAMRSEAVAGV